MLLSRRLLAALVLALLLSACLRRPGAVLPLDSRVSHYHPALPPPSVPSRLARVEVPRSLPGAPLVRPRPANCALLYEQAYQELADMLAGRAAPSFKRAVFDTENAYLDHGLSYARFCQRVAALAQVCRAIQATNESTLRYPEKDRADVARNAAIFQLLKDSVHLANGTVLAPYRYDFDDFTGARDWRKMFVNKLLATHTGNCHSLPLLYKILADETGAPAWLALAPNHIYLKQHNRQQGWYNTELTSFTFPVDAWLMASGYVSKETIVSGIYMDTLGTQQNIALCLVDLAKGYERRVGRPASATFAAKCAELALRHYPAYINAQLLQAELLRLAFQQSPPEAAPRSYAAMEAAYTRVFSTGYREMPAQVYADWLQLAESTQSTATQPR